MGQKNGLHEKAWLLGEVKKKEKKKKKKPGRPAKGWLNRIT